MLVCIRRISKSIKYINKKRYSKKIIKQNNNRKENWTMVRLGCLAEI